MPESDDALGARGQLILGVYHVLIAFVLLHILLNVWPPANPKAADPARAPAATPPISTTATATDQIAGVTTDPVAPSPSTPAASSSAQASSGDNAAKSETKPEVPPAVTLFRRFTFYPTLDGRLILLVLVAGALGSYVHAATSFVDYVGNRRFIKSWIWWYLMRPFVGMILALILYFLVRAGFVTSSSIGTTDVAAAYINPFGIAAVAAMAGMFSKQATDKLNEVFTNFFRTESGEGDDSRKDKLTNPEPTIKELSPPGVTTGSVAPVTLTGTNFQESSVIHVNGSPRETRFINSTSLGLDLAESDTTTAGVLEITVVNPPPGGGTSSPATLVIKDNAGNPVATIEAITPPKVARATLPPLTLTGTNFQADSVIHVSGLPRATRFINSTNLGLDLVETDTSEVRDLEITVVNPAPGGGRSSPKNLSIT